MIAAIRHGESRREREETTIGESAELLQGVYAGELRMGLRGVTYRRTVKEKWCAGCRRWIKCDGLMGALSFEFDHQHGKEVRP